MPLLQYLDVPCSSSFSTLGLVTGVHQRTSLTIREHGVRIIEAIVLVISLVWFAALLLFFLLILFLIRLVVAWCRRTFQFAYSRFQLIHEANVLVVLHQSSRGFVIVPLDCARTEVHLSQRRYLHSRHVQHQRDREERHPERHRKPRLHHRRP